MGHGTPDLPGKREFKILISHLKHLREDLRDEVPQQPYPTYPQPKPDGLRLSIKSEKSTHEEEIVCEKWSLYNSIFFVFTAIATIGYGAHAPQTQLGRGLCIIYLLIGIPINSLLVGSIGANFLNKGRKLFYRKKNIYTEAPASLFCGFGPQKLNE